MRTSFHLLSCVVLVSVTSSALRASTTQSAGGGQPFRNEQPSLALNYIINISGIEEDLGEVGIFADNFAPRGWALAEGQLLSVENNDLLFGKLGTHFGGDGETTFALPDLRGRVPIGAGQSPGLPNYTLGQRGGTEQVTLSVSELPNHQHDIGTGYQTEATGQAAAHSNMQPYLALTPIIATQGIFPSRSLTANTDAGVAPFGTGGGDPFLGEVTWIAHEDVPQGWMIADGRDLQIRDHQALFSILGTTYGGDGRVEFSLPDLRGHTPVGPGQGSGLTNRPLGSIFGETTETLTTSQLPNHTHQLPDNLGETEATGGTDPQSNLQPSLAVTHLIALRGTFPSRNLSASTDENPELAALGSGDQAYFASVSMFAGNFAPRDYAKTDGQLLQIASNPALFSLVGIEYGGDGRSTFGLPDLKGRATVGIGTGEGLTSRSLGDEFGSETEMLTTAHLATHTHQFTVIGGDFDLDGDVDGSDFLAWQRGDSPDPHSADDLALWRTNYGSTATTASGTVTVPEPASMLLFICAVVSTFTRRPR